MIRDLVSYLQGLFSRGFQYDSDASAAGRLLQEFKVGVTCESHEVEMRQNRGWSAYLSGAPYSSQDDPGPPRGAVDEDKVFVQNFIIEADAHSL